jgi:hypothetical protein
MRDGRCPFCESTIAAAQIDLAAPFSCPACGERLLTRLPAVSAAGATIVVGALTIGMLERVIAWWAALLIGLCLPLLRFALHVALSRLFGATIDPFSDG